MFVSLISFFLSLNLLCFLCEFLNVSCKESTSCVHILFCARRRRPSVAFSGGWLLDLSWGDCVGWLLSTSSPVKVWSNAGSSRHASAGGGERLFGCTREGWCCWWERCCWNRCWSFSYRFTISPTWNATHWWGVLSSYVTSDECGPCLALLHVLLGHCMENPQLLTFLNCYSYSFCVYGICDVLHIRFFCLLGTQLLNFDSNEMKRCIKNSSTKL